MRAVAEESTRVLSAKDSTPTPALADLFSIVGLHLPKEAQVNRWSTVAQVCSLETFGCFELGLDTQKNPVFDFSIRFKKPREAVGLERAGLVSKELSRLLDYWRSNTEEADPITSVWIEYDLDRWVDGPPEPIFFSQFGFSMTNERILEEFFPLLLDDSLDAGRRKLMERVLRELPPQARVLYISNLRGRGVAGARVELTDLPFEEVAHYLNRIDGRDWSAQVAAAAPFTEKNQQFHFAFDVTDRVEPRLGFQSGFLRQPAREPGWAELFSRLERGELCTSKESRIVLDWTGVDTAKSVPKLWPAQDGKPVHGSCFRGVSHVKVLSWPDRSMQAKVYLLFGHMPPRST